jgi:hypothetical protein
MKSCLLEKTFLAFIDQRLREITQRNAFMGGLHVLFVEDLFQLRPVKDGYVFEDLVCGYNVLGGNFWRDNIELYELHEQMRQREARIFADMLKRFREGEQTQEDIDFIMALVIDKANPPPGYNIFIKHLFATNVALNAHNRLVYDKSDSLALMCKARDTFMSRNLPPARKEILQAVLNNVPPQEFHGLYQTLQLHVGLQVEVVLNEDISDGIFNGAYRHLRSVTFDERDVPSRLWIEFANERIGKQLRKRFGRPQNNSAVDGAGESSRPKANWTALYPVSRCQKITSQQDSEVQRVQFPVLPATACTFKRAQGTTLKTAALDFSGIASPGRHYVGLSRLTSPDNLFILDFGPDKILTSEKVKMEMARLCQTKQVKLSVPNLTNLYPQALTIIAHNGRSLHAHIPEVRADTNFLAVDVILYTETRACRKDGNTFYDLSGFKLSRADAGRLRSGQVWPHHGTAIHHRDYLDALGEMVYSCCGLDVLKQNFETALPQLSIITLIFLYRSEQYVSVQQLCDRLRPVLEAVQSEKVVIAADFNVDLLHHSAPAFMLQTLMETFGFEQHVKVHTHKYGALLDHVWTNLGPSFSVTSGVLVSYWSDHSPVWCRIEPIECARSDG